MRVQVLLPYIIVLFFVGINAKAQDSTTMFIQPHLGFTYDSTQLKTLPPATNSVYNTASIIFKEKAGQNQAFSLMIKTDYLFTSVTEEDIDEWITASIAKYSTLATDTLKGVEAKRFDSNGFVGVLAILEGNSSNFKGKFFLTYLQRYGEKYATTLVTSNWMVEGQSYEQQIHDITAQIKSYTRDDNEPNSENQYQVSVVRVPYEGEYPYRTMEKGEWVKKYTTNRDTIPKSQWLSGVYAFGGEVIVSPSLDLPVSKLFLETEKGLSAMYIRKGKPLMIYCKEAEEGLNKRKGYLVVIAENGQEMVLPFEFEFYE